jgi:hypothetical protein
MGRGGEYFLLSYNKQPQEVIMRGWPGDRFGERFVNRLGERLG